MNNIEIRWFGHSSFQIINQNDGRVIYIDPYNLPSLDNIQKADYIFITHSHYDHCSLADMEKVVKENCVIVVTPDAQSKVVRFKVPVNILLMEPNQEIVFGNLKLTSIPAYNVDKHFHPKEENWVGYILKFINENITIYHSGDTDLIPEMQKLTGYCQKDKEFVAILPVGGRYTMTAEEAANAASLIKPTLVIPMHYGSLAGTREDAREFAELCEEKGIKAMILEKS
ncbi:Zn-dependent hydrolase [Candidatus Pacearchaeota archaeon CG10_big_fil_rev_8_21_14_0_10_32_14]|nr:MAG: Zn-dependent hydrolase [Candidatus Pacearchaeota archaeon CG10_big_fil_rev_8_21_14_0_10_32_14]